MQKTSPYTALACLILWQAGKLTATEDDVDTWIDAIIAILEECNNERYRFAPDTEPQPELPEGE